MTLIPNNSQKRCLVACSTEKTIQGQFSCHNQVSKKILNIKAPFTKKQVNSLNKFQKETRYHPFTCCSPEEIVECTRASKEIDGEIIKGTTDGLLVATEEGWVCPCGRYKQDWAYAFMLEG